MAISWLYTDEGSVALDSETRMATVYDTQGQQVGEPRPYTAEENARADAAAAAATAQSNERNIRAKALDAINTNTQVINQLKSFAAGTASLTNAQRDSALRDLANQQARALGQINALARLAISEFSGTE